MSQVFGTRDVVAATAPDVAVPELTVHPDVEDRQPPRLPRFDPRRLPGWVQALVILAASRVLSTYVVLRCAVLAPPHRDGRPWTYLQLANNWDGTWYERVAREGYPAHLPLDAAGAVAQNTWAFYPLFPGLVRAVRWTGLAWTPAATVVSLACTAGAVVLLRVLIARLAGPRTALWSVAFLCFFPAALVLQLPYSEALALLLLVAVLLCLQRGRYLLVVPLLLLVGLARPVAAPLAAVLTVHLLGEAWSLRALPRSLAARSLGGPLLAWLAGVVAAVEWPLVAWWRTGVPDAYTRTMASWRSSREIVPFRPWREAVEGYLGTHLGPLLLVAVLAGLLWWLWQRGRHVLGRDLTVWCVAYPAYLLAVLDSFTSLPRYLLFMFPIGTLLASVSTARAYRVAVTVASAALGLVWTLVIWRSHLWAP